MSNPALRDKLRHASIPTLVMSLAQITGDDRWLQEPFLPKRDVKLFADESGGLSGEAQATVREAMERVLDELASGSRRLPPAPTEDRLLRMMNVCVAEEVAPEYAPLMMEEFGFANRDVRWTHEGVGNRAPDFQVLIVGAGLSGICAAIKLNLLGIRWTIVEKNPEIGGTWWENDYPECGVDTPNHFYSYSFAPNFRWTNYFSKCREVWDYITEVARNHGVLDSIELGSEVRSLHWHEDRQSWGATIRGADGQTRTTTANVVIGAVGQMNRPKMPKLPGLCSFPGAYFHSAQWRHDVSLADRRVAVVGTGASAMQLLRTVAGQARHVTVFQRSPQWVRPNADYNREVTADTMWMLEHVPYYYNWYRFGLFWRVGDGLLKTLRRDPDWPYPERAMNAANDRHRQQMTSYVMEELKGREDLIDKVLPDYPPYGKRILIDNDWFRTLRCDNVSLVTAAVEGIKGSSVVDTNGKSHEVDVLIFGTGFEAGKILGSIDIRGRGGVSLQDVWKEDDPRAFLGLAMPGFPNFFCLYGPNTNLGHGGSVIFQAECQARYVTRCLVRMMEQRISSMEVKRPVHDDYVARVDAEHRELVWTHPGMSTWYRNDNGRVFSIMPWRLVDYWSMTHDPNLNDYVLRMEGGA